VAVAFLVGMVTLFMQPLPKEPALRAGEPPEA
jgi:hypothetical protein